MAVTDDVQRTADHQRITRLLEHTPGEEIADHLLLMERRIAQHHVQRVSFLTGQPVAGPHNNLALTQCGPPVFSG